MIRSSPRYEYCVKTAVLERHHNTYHQRAQCHCVLDGIADIVTPFSVDFKVKQAITGSYLSLTP
jgi:hypothetical protein